MRKILLLLAVLTGFAALNSVAQDISESRQKAVISLAGGDNSPIAAAPIDANTVIKFRNDSVILSNTDWELATSKFDFAEFGHLESFLSPLTVHLISEKTPDFPFSGYVVSLSDLYDSEYSVSGLVESDNTVSFSDIPAGFYSLQVSDPNELSPVGGLDRIVHGMHSEYSLLLDGEHSTGVDVVVSDRENYEYFDLDGRKVSGENLTRGIYLRKSAAGKVEKIYIR